MRTVTFVFRSSSSTPGDSTTKTWPTFSSSVLSIVLIQVTWNAVTFLQEVAWTARNCNVPQRSKTSWNVTWQIKKNLIKQIPLLHTTVLSIPLRGIGIQSNINVNSNNIFKLSLIHRIHKAIKTFCLMFTYYIEILKWILLFQIPDCK